MTINNRLIKFLNDYYSQQIPENASIDYHDYNLGLKIISSGDLNTNIKFNYGKPLGVIESKDMTYLDYQKNFVDRYSGYYGNFFEVFNFFMNCNNFKLDQKIYLFFQIIAFIIEFILPSLACMVIYIIFYEAFHTLDYRIALFFTSLYLCMMFASGVSSLISRDPRKMEITNYFLYFFMELFYAIAIICSVPAMNYANKYKPDKIDLGYFDRIDNATGYKFNKAAISLLIIFCFILYIIPMILQISTIGNNIVSMLLYLLFGASCSTTNFNIIKVWNAPETSGGSKTEIRKCICIIVHLLVNFFFGSLSFYSTNRKKKANCVMGFAILFFFYSFFRTVAIAMKLNMKEESFNNKNLCDNIKRKLNNEEITEDNENDEEDNEREVKVSHRNRKNKKEIENETNIESNNGQDENEDNGQNPSQNDEIDNADS
jgi:hypothetical protein